jgi:hypothetical protein
MNIYRVLVLLAGLANFEDLRHRNSLRRLLKLSRHGLAKEPRAREVSSDRRGRGKSTTGSVATPPEPTPYAGALCASSSYVFIRAVHIPKAGP